MKGDMTVKKRTWRGLTILLIAALLIGVLAVTAFAEGADTLPKVKLTSIAPYGDGIVIRWEAVEEAELYEVYSKCEDGEWSKLANTGSTAYKDTTAEDNRTYSYTVLARSGDRVSPWDESNCLAVKKGLDDVVMGEAQPHVTGNIIRWNAVENAVFYQVLRLNPGETTWTLITNTSGTAYKDETAEIGVKYYYKVRARNGSLMSSMNIQSVSAMRPIGNVKMGETTSHYTGNIVRWEAVDGAKLYQVYRLPSGGSQWSLLAKTSGTAYKDTSAEFGIKYYYKTVAVCNSVVGSLSNVSSVSAVRPPENVTEIETEPHISGIIVRWNAAEGADKYEVLRCLGGLAWEHVAYTTATAYKDTTAEWGVTYNYTVRAMAGSVKSAGYDTIGVVGRITLDDEVIAALCRAMRKRIQMEQSGEYGLEEMVNAELSYLDNYLEGSLCENQAIDNACYLYHDGLMKQLRILSSDGSCAGREMECIEGYYQCSEAIYKLYKEGFFTSPSDADIRENYVETYPIWDAINTAYHDLYSDIYRQLVGKDWNVSSDGSYVYQTYTNNTKYTITTEFCVAFLRGNNPAETTIIRVTNLAPGQSVTIKAEIPSYECKLGIDWSHVKISQDNTVIVDFS